MNNIDFRPAMLSGGKLSIAEVHHRQQICTTSALADLEASPEYKLWKRQQDARGPFSTLKSLWQDIPQLIIASVMFLVVILLIGASVSLRHQAAQVHNASNAVVHSIAASTNAPPPPAQLPSPPLSQQQQQQQQHLEVEPKKSIISSNQLTNLVESLQSDLKTGRQAVAAAKARAAKAEAQAALLTSKTQQLQDALAKASLALSSQPPLPKTWSEVGELVLSFIISRPVSSERRFNNVRAMMISPTMALSLLGLVAGIVACSIGIVISMILRMKQTRYHQTEAKLIAAVPGQTRMELDRLRGQLATAKLELTAARRAIQQQQVQVQRLVKAPVKKIVEKANNNSNDGDDAVGEQWRQAAVSVWTAVVSSSSPESVTGAALLMSSNDTIPAVKATHSQSHHTDNNTNATMSPAAWVDAILNHFQTLSEALATTTAERSNAIDTAAAAQAECQRFQSAATAFEKKIQQEGEKYDAIISNLQEKLHVTESDAISAKDALTASQQRCAVLDTQAQQVGAALEDADDQRRALEERVVGLEQELSSLTALAETLSSDKKALLSTDASYYENNRGNMASVGTTNPTNTIMGQIMAARHISDRSNTTTGGATLADYFSRRLDSVASMLSGGGGNSSSREGRVSADNSAVSKTDGGDDDGTWLERTNQLFESAESLLGAQLPSSLTHHQPPPAAAAFAAAPSSDNVAAVVVAPAAAPTSSSSMMLDQEERLLSALQTSSEQVGELLAALHTAQQLDCRSSSDIDRNAALIRAENQLRVAHDKVAGAVADLKSAGQGVVQSKGGVRQLAEVMAEKYKVLEACQKVVEQGNQAKIAAERDIDANNATLADIQVQLQNPFAEEAELKHLRDAALAALDVAVEAKRVAVADLTAAHQAVKNAEGEYVQAARELSQAETKAAEVAAVKNGAAGGLQLAQKRLLTALEAANIALQIDL